MTQVSVSVRGLELSAGVEGEGAPLLLLHGIPGSGHVWGDVVERLRADHLVVTPDLLGFGRSSRTSDLERLWIGGQAEALSALLEQLDLSSITVVGHDYGGPVASALLCKARDRIGALALLATNAFPDTPLPFPLSTIGWPVAGDLLSRLLFSAPSLRMMVRRGQGRPAGRVDPRAAVGDAAQAAAIQKIFSTALLEISTRYAPVESALRDARLPAAVLWGERDPFFPVEQGLRTAKLLGDDVSFTVLDGAGHFLPEERPDEVARTLRELVRGRA